MRIVTRGILATLAGAGLIVITLAGCATPASPLSTPTPSPSAIHAPVFASDEEALKAATDAYAAYLAMSDTIAQEGGINPERIKDYAADDELASALKSFEQYRQAGAHNTGSTRFAGVRLQSASYLLPESTSVVIYVCNDVSGVDVLDRAGASLVKPGRPSMTPFEVSTAKVTGRGLVVTSKARWEGDDFCV
jgi:hypothetical protein